MGIIEDITNLMRKGPELASQLDSIKLNTKSVIKGANDATFQFGCLMSDTIPIDMANTTVRTLDRVYASFTQTWISLHPFMDISLDPTPISYLKRLHQNMRMESVEEYEDNGELLESCIEEAYNGNNLLYMNKNKTFGVMFSVAENSSVEMLKSNKRYLESYLSDFDLKPITEAESDGTNALDLADAVINSKLNKVQNDERNTIMKQTADNKKAPQLLDRDVKKSNDMVPFAIQVRLIAKNEKNEFVQYIDFILGVKAILHPVKSDDMIENIQRAMQNKSLFFKLLRWTTGEISLFKNIIFNIDDIKMDTVNRETGKSPWFGSLKRLKNKKVGMRNLTVPHALIPNTTIVISSYEADYLKNNMAIDVRNPSVAKKLISSLFLVAFVIIDEGTGTIDILYDGSDAYQTYALETLERENSMTSNKLGREIGRMISH